MTAPKDPPVFSMVGNPWDSPSWKKAAAEYDIDWDAHDRANAASEVVVPFKATLESTEPKPSVLTSANFVKGFVPPSYLVHGVLQEAFLYSLTGATGSGKTSITLRLAASIATGVLFAGRVTRKRRVLYLAAENPEDVRMRWIALAQRMCFDVDEIEVFFVEGVWRISKMADHIKAEVAKIGGEFGLVVVDTSPVFYEGDDENSRTQQGRHAELLRSLIYIVPGKPAVIANCHPTKNAGADSLVPAGGGSFLNSVDGNLTCARSGSTTELHWQGKYRGIEFGPMRFVLKTVTHQDLKDGDGNLIPTVICEHISEEAGERIRDQKFADENRLLQAILDNPKGSLAKFAVALGLKYHSGEPDTSKVNRLMANLKRDKLVKITRSGHYRVTSEGRDAINSDE